MRLIMIKKILFLSSLISLQAYAENYIDVYGENLQNSRQLLQEYGNQLKLLADIARSHPIQVEDTHIDKVFLEKKTQLLNQIKREKHYTYADIETLTYFDKHHNYYVTLEVIPKNQSARMKYIGNIKSSQLPSSQKTNDVITQRIAFDEIALKVLMSHADSPASPCPVYFCPVGFQNPQLKPYLAIFNLAAKENKKLILDTLKQDSDPKRREAAAFLTAHFKSAQEVLTTLLPYINDPQREVRNASLWVISSTLQKTKKTDINIMPFISLLDSPYLLDREKAMMVIAAVTNETKNKRLLVQHSGDQLIRLLAMNQPLSHQLAYKILKAISGKNYSSNNIAIWKNWLDKKISR